MVLNILKVIVIYFMSIKFTICNKDSILANTVPLTNFRKQVEEITVDKESNSKTQDPSHNLVLFLVNNVKEIFGKSEEPTILLEPENDNDETTLALRKTIATDTPTPNNDKRENLDKTSSIIEHSKNSTESIKILKTSLAFIKNGNITTLPIEDDTEKAELLNLSKDLVILQKAEQAERDNQVLDKIQPAVVKSMLERDTSITRRSCILCNNVAVMECNDPKNKLMPSTVCEGEEDLCYSLHTPFGIVDRGCFNVNHNLTTYVCSCNLCNYISISEMPYIFSTKKDWVENVIELSRTKRLRNSIFRDMSCLRCEVNTSTKTGDMLDNANCLEGNVGTLPIQECADSEICGVKAIRSEGYIWRGCVTKPLYNYWWTLCDSDLCNYDSLVSIYDAL